MTKRDELRAKHAARETWRRHEIAKRLEDIRLELKKSKRSLDSMIEKLEKILPEVADSTDLEDVGEDVGEAPG